MSSTFFTEEKKKLNSRIFQNKIKKLLLNVYDKIIMTLKCLKGFFQYQGSQSLLSLCYRSNCAAVYSNRKTSVSRCQNSISVQQQISVAYGLHTLSVTHLKVQCQGEKNSTRVSLTFMQKRVKDHTNLRKYYLFIYFSLQFYLKYIPIIYLLVIKILISEFLSLFAVHFWIALWVVNTFAIKL